jgi:hypothetical protein
MSSCQEESGQTINYFYRIANILLTKVNGFDNTEYKQFHAIDNVL